LRVCGGSTFAFAPDDDVRRRPAIWNSRIAPCVITVEGCDGIDTLPPLITGSRRIVASNADRRGISLVADGERARHRVRLLANTGRSGEPRFALHADQWVNERFAALAALLRQAIPVHPFLPTPFRRERLVRMLAILDLLDLPSDKPATVRQIAQEVTFRGLPSLRAAEWKASSQRRHTQRLIAEAEAMRDRGYLKLLLGQVSRTDS